jgi:hypothetical protein
MCVTQVRIMVCVDVQSWTFWIACLHVPERTDGWSTNEEAVGAISQCPLPKGLADAMAPVVIAPLCLAALASLSGWVSRGWRAALVRRLPSSVSCPLNRLSPTASYSPRLPLPPSLAPSPPASLPSSLLPASLPPHVNECVHSGGRAFQYSDLRRCVRLLVVPQIISMCSRARILISCLCRRKRARECRVRASDDRGQWWQQQQQQAARATAARVAANSSGSSSTTQQQLKEEHHRRQQQQQELKP